MKSAAQAFKDKDWWLSCWNRNLKSYLLIGMCSTQNKSSGSVYFRNYSLHYCIPASVIILVYVAVIFEINLLCIFTRIFTWLSYMNNVQKLKWTPTSVHTSNENLRYTYTMIERKLSSTHHFQIYLAISYGINHMGTGPFTNDAGFLLDFWTPAPPRLSYAL